LLNIIKFSAKVFYARLLTLLSLLTKHLSGMVELPKIKISPPEDFVIFKNQNSENYI